MKGLEDLLQEFFGRGVIVTFRPMHFWAGLLCKMKEHWFCFVNSNNPFENQRWTLAHELGHFILHKGDGKHLFTDGIFCGTQEDAEWQANCFAAELLMPFEKLKETLKKSNDFPIEKILLASSTFQVPPKMAAWWLFELGLISKRIYSFIQKTSF